MVFDKSKVLKVIRGRRIRDYTDGSMVYLGKEGKDCVGNKTLVLVMNESASEEQSKEEEPLEEEHPFESELKQRLDSK